MVPVIHFIGKSGIGKTTLIESTVRELKKKGIRVAVIKHAHHGFELDKQGKDTWRFAEAGSDLVVVSSPDRMGIIEKVPEEQWLPDILPRVIDKVDVVLVEGYKMVAKIKIEVTGTEKNEDLTKTVDFIIQQIEMGQQPK